MRRARTSAASSAFHGRMPCEQLHAAQCSSSFCIFAPTRAYNKVCVRCLVVREHLLFCDERLYICSASVRKRQAHTRLLAVGAVALIECENNLRTDKTEIAMNMCHFKANNSLENNHIIVFLITSRFNIGISVYETIKFTKYSIKWCLWYISF